MKKTEKVEKTGTTPKEASNEKGESVGNLASSQAREDDTPKPSLQDEIQASARKLKKTKTEEEKKEKVESVGMFASSPLYKKTIATNSKFQELGKHNKSAHSDSDEWSDSDSDDDDLSSTKYRSNNQKNSKP